MTYKVYIYPINENPNILKDFYKKVQKSTKQKIVRQLSYLEEYGLSSEVIDLKKIKGYDFWEVRILGKENIRIFVWGSGTDIFVIHMFKKKKQETDVKELSLAKSRLKLLQKVVVTDS